MQPKAMATLENLHWPSPVAKQLIIDQATV